MRIFIVFLLLCNICAAEEIVLVHPDNPPPLIVVPQSPQDQEQYAIDDLQHYLQRITGREISVVTEPPREGISIRIGNVAGNEDLQQVIEKKNLGRDGFVIDVSEKEIRILGGSKFGTAYGVYELLERLGVRWLFPGEWGEVVPNKPELRLPAGQTTDKPVFTIRQMHLTRYGESMNDPTVAWMRRNRHNRNGFFGHNTGLINPAKYGKSHPEWYAEVNGQRQPSGGGFKLCHSNPEMVQQAIADVLAAIRKQKETPKPFIHGVPHRTDDYNVFSISPTDGGGFCQCEKCQKMGSLPDRLQIFANTIAREVRKEFPDYFVGYYGAYSSHQDPPTIKAEPGVLVIGTEWDRDFKAPLSAMSNRNFREKIEKYAEKCPELAIYTYDGLTIWWGTGPLSFAKRNSEDYKWYADHGVKGVNSEVQAAAWGVLGYHYYMLGKLWWNPYANLDELKNDFVQAAYGKAAGPMRKYYDILDNAVIFPSPSDIYEMRQHLEEAARMADTPEARYRIDNLRAHYFAASMLDKYQAEKATEEELTMMHNAMRSIEPISSTLKWDSGFSAAFPDVFKGIPAYYTEKSVREAPLNPEELHELLNKVVLEKAADRLPSWPAQNDMRLKPLSDKRAAFNPDMGMDMRDSATILIYAEQGEHIQISQSWKWKGPFETAFELQSPEQLVIAKGTATEKEILDVVAPIQGVYTFRIGPKSWPHMLVANRYAVVKANSASERIYTVDSGVANGWFYVPKGTKEFAIITRPREPLTIDIKAPSGALPPIVQKVRNFQEHRIAVPEGDDGKVWRLRLAGQSLEFYFEGIPPLLASDPNRLIVPMEEKPNAAANH